MPHDCKAQELNEGDEVLIRAKVTSVHPGQTAGQNLGLQVLNPEDKDLSEYLPSLHIHSGLVQKVGEMESKLDGSKCLRI